MLDQRQIPTDRITRSPCESREVTADLLVDDLIDTAAPELAQSINRPAIRTMPFSTHGHVKMHARIRSWLRDRGISA